MKFDNLALTKRSGIGLEGRGFGTESRIQIRSYQHSDSLVGKQLFSDQWTSAANRGYQSATKGQRHPEGIGAVDTPLQGGLEMNPEFGRFERDVA